MSDSNNNNNNNPLPMFQMSSSELTGGGGRGTGGGGSMSAGNSLAGGLPGMGIGMGGMGGSSGFDLDLEELFVDCYYDTPGLSSMANNQAANGGQGVPTTTTTTTAAPAAASTKKSSSSSSSSARGTKRPASSDAAGGGGGGEDNDDDLDLDSKPASELTMKQKIERRERNREHAKRSRLRKKFLLESLQEQIAGLQEQMDRLKQAMRSEIPGQGRADKLIDDICGSSTKYTPLPMPSGFGPVKTLMEPDFRLMSALSGSQQNFAISDPTLPDNPIVYVSQGFLDLTGYQLDQVLGRNCRFLQGPGTDQSAVDVIRKGITEGIDTSVCLLNYKADGTPFWNQFFVAALRDAENNVVNYVGVQCEVSKAVVEKHMGPVGSTSDVKGK
eukprot:CAMPEP_0113462760 /NCGR_PEP_ID=MMETSP0014_2-20120614/12278_1 /TAXON_ID=2857 /ORGANISM="Nitzschia sp." /LENGTH=385 /DNA_ID=CAMNT_0000354673 /DNA_START=232 /DNA_END=1389 /DNA_ORIENTATION=+ /assembly_acc=CAM_ASM_000159